MKQKVRSSVNFRFFPSSQQSLIWCVSGWSGHKERDVFVICLLLSEDSSEFLRNFSFVEFVDGLLWDNELHVRLFTFGIEVVFVCTVLCMF